MKRRLLSALIFIVLLGLEIWIALYVHDRIVRPYIGDVLVVICVYFLARVVAPRMRWLSIPVMLFAFCVEAVQLTGLSGILPEPFSTIVGGTFDPADLLCYLAGGVVCFLIDKKFYSGRERRKPFEVSVDPFYSQENMTRLRNSVAQMEATGGTVHEVDIDD